MAGRLSSPSNPLARRLAVAIGAVAVAAAAPAPALAWSPPEPVPVIEPSSQPDASLRLREDDSAFFLINGGKAGSNTVTRAVQRPPAGPPTVLSPFASGFGEYSTSRLLLISPLDAFGNLLAIRQASPYDAVRLTPGANPAAAVPESTGSRISHVDVAPGGEAVAIVGGGSTAGVSFRPAGPAGRFDTPRELDRAGNQRSYGIGITLDPDGGVHVVYRTEQERAVLQAYAPPGGDFGPPQLIDIPTTTIGTAGWEPVFAQSTNGHAMLAWSESTGGNSNAEQVWAVARKPGGLFGAKSLVASVPVGNSSVIENYGGIADDGTQYVAYRESVSSSCPTNVDGDSTMVLAVRPYGGAWTRTVDPNPWPKRSQFGPIATAGNRVAVVVTRSTDSGARCESADPTSSLGVRLGQSTALGPEVTLATEGIVNGPHPAVIHSDGIAVNSRGGAIAISDVPTATGGWTRYLHFHSSVAKPDPPAPPKPVPAPGRIYLGGKTLKARGGDIPFEAGCIRIQPGDKVYCHITAIALEQERRRAGKATVAAKKQAAKGKAKRKKKAKKPKVLARAKRVRIAPGKRRKVTLKLNKLGKKKLRAAGRRGIRIALRVTIKKGGKTQTIDRKVTVKAAKKKPKKVKRRGAGKR